MKYIFMNNNYILKESQNYLKVSNGRLSIEANGDNAKILTYAFIFMLVCVGISALMSK